MQQFIVGRLFLLSDLLDPWPQKCARVVAEIFSTEEKYVTTLNDIVQVREFASQLTKLTYVALYTTTTTTLCIVCHVKCFAKLVLATKRMDSYLYSSILNVEPITVS